MKVLWLTQLPYSQLPNTKNPQGHPVPWIASLAQPLSDQIELTIASNNGRIEADEEFMIGNIRYWFIKAPRLAFNLASLNSLSSNVIHAKLMKRIQEFDLIHIHGSESMLHQACWNLPVPKVLSVQGIIDEYYRYLEEPFSRRRLLWQVARHAENTYLPKLSHFMCRTEWDKAWVKRNCANAVIHHCWECIRREFFETQVDPTDKNKIFFLGGGDYIKGNREALVAFNKALHSAPELKLVYVLPGGPSEAGQIEEFITANNLDKINSDNLIIKSRMAAAEMIAEYRNCFCLLHPSYIDNSPNTVCEAQIIGLPVIASKVGGVGSLIEHGKTGILTSLNTDDISKAIVDLYRDKQKQQAIASTALPLARERHNASDIVHTTLAIYENVIKSAIPINAAV